MASYCQVTFLPSDLRVNDYDPIAPVYDEAMGDDFATAIADPLIAAARPHLPSAGAGRYLDLGCGSAAVLGRVAAQTGAECFGIDLSSQQIKWALHKLAAAGIRASLSVGDVLSAPMPTQCHVVAMNLDAVNHLTNPSDWPPFFEKVFSALAPGGLFWLDVNTPKRLLEDWDHAEVILKEGLTYVQCPVGPGASGGVARRRIVIHVFKERDGMVRRHSALIEQIALPASDVLGMLRSVGFGDVTATELGAHGESRHIFLKNRLFISAVK